MSGGTGCKSGVQSMSGQVQTRRRRAKQAGEGSGDGDYQAKGWEDLFEAFVFDCGSFDEGEDQWGVNGGCQIYLEGRPKTYGCIIIIIVVLRGWFLGLG